MPAERQVAGQPRDHEIEKVVAGEVTEGCAPEGTLGKDMERVETGLGSGPDGKRVAWHPLKPGWKP